MKPPIATTLVALGVSFASPAFAQQTGTTSGPAAGKNVEPSTVTEKRYESDQERLKGGVVGGGSPGVELKPGTEGGKAERPGK